MRYLMGFGDNILATEPYYHGQCQNVASRLQSSFQKVSPDTVRASAVLQRHDITIQMYVIIHLPLVSGEFRCRCMIIGVGRFRILGGPRGGPKSQQAHDVEMTSMRRNDVASTSFRRHVPTRFLINQF